MLKLKINKNTVKKIISTAASVILAATICFCLFVVVQVLTKGYASLGKHSFFKVVTPSMEPNLSVGEVIATKSVKMDEVKVGDIISFRSQSPDMFGRIITHRVVEIKTAENGEICFVTQGDANLSVDGRYVLESNFIGKVTWNSGKAFISKFVKFVSSGYGFVACIAFPLILILSFLFSSGVKHIKRDLNELVENMEKQAETNAPEVEASELSKQEYDEMYKRIKDELLEELKESEDTQSAKTE